MSNLLHVCLYNTDPGASEELGNAIRSLNFVRLLAEVSTAAELNQFLHSSAINLIFFHLDPITVANSNHFVHRRRRQLLESLACAPSFCIFFIICYKVYVVAPLICRDVYTVFSIKALKFWVTTITCYSHLYIAFPIHKIDC